MNTFESFLAVQGRNQVYSECCFAKKPVQTSSAKQTKKLRALAPSSSKFNLKRHQKDINFRWLFHVFLYFWAQKPKNIRKCHWNLMSFQCLCDVFWIEFWRWGGYIYGCSTNFTYSHNTKVQIVAVQTTQWCTFWWLTIKQDFQGRSSVIVIGIYTD